MTWTTSRSRWRRSPATCRPVSSSSVVDPGAAARTAVEHPALDANAPAANAPAAATPATPTGPSDVPTDVPAVGTEPGAGDNGSDQIDLQAATFTPKPQIYSRAQWGADEGMRDKTALHYFEVHAGFVHHTVNANDYSRAEVPGIIRSIYAYHTKSRGWSDIGYNFLVDRFGRIWEGRYGGIDRPVVGAHTLNYNDYAFAMSAIGNYDVTQPSSAMVAAYGALFAWKLSLHGVDASSTSQQVGSKVFPAINGHRDAASTACPGKYLYARIPDIRRLAAAAQRGWAGRELESDLASTPNPDLVTRRASDGQVFIIPTGGLSALTTPVASATGLLATDRTVVSPDLTGDKIPDLVVQAGAGVARVRPGTASGTFGPARSRTIGRLAKHDLVTAVGDLNGDRRNDLVARVPATGRLDVLLGHGNGTFTRVRPSTTWRGYNLLTGIGDVTGDRKADLLARSKSGRLYLHAGNGKGKFAKPVALAGNWSRFSSINGLGDFTADGRQDLFVRKGTVGYVLPGRGRGRFGSALGPMGDLPAAARVVGVTQLVGDGTPDVVVRNGDTVAVLANQGGTEVRQPIATGVFLPTANALLNAGDWDRDGHGDIISRTADGVLELRRGDGTGAFSAPLVIGRDFGAVQLLAAVGDMTGDGWPDLMGQPTGGAVRIYPGSGLAGLERQLRRARSDQRDRPGAGRALERRRRPGLDLRPGREDGALPGQRAWRSDRRPRTEPGPDAVRLGHRDQRHQPVGPPRPGGSPALQRLPVPAPGQRDGLRHSALPGAGHGGVRPGRLRPGTDMVLLGPQGKRAVARSATYVAARRSGPEWTTSTSEPPRASGSVKEASPGGEAGFASESRRPPSDKRFPTAAALHVSAWVRSPKLPAVAGSSSCGGSCVMKESGCDQTSIPTSCTPCGTGSAKRTPSGSSEQASTGRSSACPAHRAREAGPQTTASASSSGPTTASPTVHAAPRKTGPSQCVGRSRARRWPRSRSNSSVRSDAVLATQFAYVVTDSSTRSPVASS